jgi:hypothetical protein
MALEMKGINKKGGAAQPSIDFWNLEDDVVRQGTEIYARQCNNKLKRATSCTCEMDSM